MIYVDTSALIKRYIQEAGSSAVRALLAQATPLATATLAYVEMFATFYRRQRDGHLTASQSARLAAHFESDWRSYIRVPLHDDILRLGRNLARAHPLRGADAVHLASALSLRDTLGEAVRFVAADHRLLSAAAAEGLEPLDPSAA